MGKKTKVSPKKKISPKKAVKKVATNNYLNFLKELKKKPVKSLTALIAKHKISKITSTVMRIPGTDWLIEYTDKKSGKKMYKLNIAVTVTDEHSERLKYEIAQYNKSKKTKVSDTNKVSSDDSLIIDQGQLVNNPDTKKKKIKIIEVNIPEILKSNEGQDIKVQLTDFDKDVNDALNGIVKKSDKSDIQEDVANILMGDMDEIQKALRIEELNEELAISERKYLEAAVELQKMEIIIEDKDDTIRQYGKKITELNGRIDELSKSVIDITVINGEYFDRIQEYKASITKILKDWENDRWAWVAIKSMNDKVIDEYKSTIVYKFRKWVKDGFPMFSTNVNKKTQSI